MPEPSPENDSKQSMWRQIGRYSNLGFILPAAVVAGLVVGHLMDRWLGTSWITLAGLLAGCVAGFVGLIRGVMKAGKDT
ncbi:MAG TPA: AtpZ/AtpI family protein [Candidatus Angelobacter sp.]|nr:AtpZ/AtpI family protein [Candidatus Angelobacter sp.]